MKAIAALLLLCITASALAAGADMKAQLAALLTAKAQANDAVDSALQLLYDLLQAEHDEQADHDARHEEEVRIGNEQISQLTDVKNAIRHECDNGHDHLKFIVDEITDSENHLVWIAGRVETLNRQREELEAARCESNAIFVQTLREHNDAFEVIAWLRADLANWQAAANLENESSFAQLTSVVDKLKAYSHLFNQNAINEFVQLGDPQTWDQLTDGATRRDIDAAHVDNQRDALGLEDFDAGTGSRNVQGSLVERIGALLDKLEAHLQASMRDLEANEIRAAYDLGDWLDHADEELHALAADAERKHAYLEKLAIDQSVAQDFVDRCEVRFDGAVAALQAAVDDLNAKIAWYEAETSRRAGESDLLRECIAIFEDRVSSMKQYLRDRIEDYAPDQTFDQTTLRGVDF